LHWAAEGKDEAVIQLLLENGVEVRALDKDGRTALSWAAIYEREETMRLLEKDTKKQGGY